LLDKAIGFNRQFLVIPSVKSAKELYLFTLSVKNLLDVSIQLNKFNYAKFTS